MAEQTFIRVGVAGRKGPQRRGAKNAQAVAAGRRRPPEKLRKLHSGWHFMQDCQRRVDARRWIRDGYAPFWGVETSIDR